MVSQANMFREYILLRSRVVVYVAAAVVVIALVGLGLAVTSASTQLYRFGLLLQFIGVMAIAPKVIGKDHPASLQTPGIPPTGEQLKETTAETSVSSEISVDAAEDQFDFYHANNRLIVIGNALASLCLIAWLAACIIDPQSLRFPGEVFLREGLGLLGFAWINSYFLVLIYRVIQPVAPRGILAAFFSIDMILSILGMVFAGAVYALVAWLRQGVQYLYGSGARRVLRVITLPLFALGLLLELISTFW